MSPCPDSYSMTLIMQYKETWLGLINYASPMQYSIHVLGTLGLYTQDYSEQLSFPLNEIHQPQLLRVNQTQFPTKAADGQGRG